MTRDMLDLLNMEVKTGSITRSPDEDYCLVLEAPPAQDHALSRVTLVEPPEGELQAQITYLVERLNRLTPYLSDELVSRIVTNPGDARIMPEHRPVTVMFANYLGISELIEDLGDSQPELIITQLNSYFVHMAEIVERYEGMLARMDQYAVGDRLVIFFGAPRAHEDDPVRAVYTALEMQEATRQHFSALQTPSGIYRFRQRIGINTGHLFAGNVGAPNLRQEYTLMGDDINMAARLMSNSGWQEILISRKTQEHVMAFFELKDRGDLKVKGKEILIHAFEVLGRREEIGRTRGLDTGESPLVGRDEALETLKASGQGLLRKRGRIVSIIGNSGLGKSRLTRELKNWLVASTDQDGLLWLEAQALSFSEQMSYWLIMQIIRSALGLKPDANKDDVLFTLWERGEDLLGKETAREAIPFLAHLMGLELEGEWAKWVVELDPKVRQKQTFWAAREFFTALARQRPVVLVLDDLHWADAASLSLTEGLLSVTENAPLMFCLIFRARRDKPCWRLRDKAARTFPHRYTEITLQPLSQPESLFLLGKLLPGAEFNSETQQEILAKAAGNPFYLEEVVRSLVDGGAVVLTEDDAKQWRVTDKIEQITVPQTLQAAIVARIDRLTEDARQALQMAAVIGRQFQLDFLRNLAQAEAQLDAWLVQLERNGLIRPTEGTSEMAYAFPDALVQEVAYESLRVQSRQEFHHRIGEMLESVFAGRFEQECELLAYHFSRSDLSDPDNQEKAIKYLNMAIKKARHQYANETVIQNYTKLLEIYTTLGKQAGQAEALYQMGVMAYEIGDYSRARPWLERAVSLWEDIKDTENEAWSVMYLGMLDLKQANYNEAARHHRYALALAESRQDVYQEGIHLTNVARVSLRMGEYERAIQQLQQPIEMKKQLGDIKGQGFCLFYMGLAYIYLGQYDEAEAAFESSLRLWQQVAGNERGLSYCQHGLGRLALAGQRFEDAERYFQTAYDMSAKLLLKAEIIENLSYLGQSRLGLGKLEAALDASEQAIMLLAEQKDVEEAQQIYLNHYYVLSTRGDPAARDFLQKAYDTMMSQAERIPDAGERRTFLEKVKVNQAINALV